MAAKSVKPINFPVEFIGKFVKDESFRTKVLSKAKKSESAEAFEFRGFRVSKRQVEALRLLDEDVIKEAIDLVRQAEGVIVAE